MAPKKTYYVYPYEPITFTNGYSFEFDGVNQGVDTGAINIDATGGMTLSCWVKPVSLGTWDYLCSRGAAAGIDSTLNFRFPSWGGLYANYSGASVYTGLTFTAGVWAHLLITFNYATGDVYFYKNNVASATVLGFASIYSNAILNCIGCATVAGANSASIKIDEFAVFKTVLNSSERAAVYNSGVPADLSTLAPYVWFQMGDNASWDGSNWTIANRGSYGGSATGINLALGSRTTDIP